ncbi:hypothetical protein [Chryseolinea sp. H1M3-3]|uniref:hypothetical protein n=1 Tax=Chryseolinea sp. H1M3-3 TaxID=3034144 RepID=UPI0023EC6691|nr:hypothetical protein [Chryseolinea sp. H1M3-3]
MNKSLTQFLLFNFASIVCLACASDYKHMRAVEPDATCISKLAPRQFSTSWYHASVDVIGKHISGLLLIKNMPDSAYRIVFTNEAGVTFFDFGFSRDGKFNVYNIINQLNKGPVIQTLRKDFELILGLPFHTKISQAWTMDDDVFYGVTQKKETAYFITSKDCASLRRLELGSSRKRKVTVNITGQPYPTPDKIEIVHNTFDMQIKLTRFEKE